jgi:CheY-like chemotaxis protein
MRTALLVERTPCVRDVCDLITPGGVRIVCVPGAAEATAELTAGLRPRLILVDLPPDSRDRLRFLRWLRAEPAHETTPLLLLAGRPASRRVHALVARHGALGALPSGMEGWRVVQVVDRLCGRTRKTTRV